MYELNFKIHKLQQYLNARCTKGIWLLTVVAYIIAYSSAILVINAAPIILSHSIFGLHKLTLRKEQKKGTKEQFQPESWI
jgi:hypothetical protein